MTDQPGMGLTDPSITSKIDENDLSGMVVWLETTKQHQMVNLGIIC